MSTEKRTIDWYNRHAEEYLAHISDSHDSPYHAYYEKPAIRGELPNLKGKSVISLGCAAGREDVRYLKDQGASRVVGIDLAEKLIDLAKKMYPDCEFYVMDMEKLEFDDETFDLAYSGLAIHYLIGGFDRAMAEAFRVLRPGGTLLFSDGHPVNSAMEYTRDDDQVREKTLGVRTDKVKNTGEVIGDYLTSRSMITELLKGETRVSDPLTFWHQPLSATINQIISAGFKLEKVIEPLPTEGFKEASPRHFERLSKIPEMIVFKASKLKVN